MLMALSGPSRPPVAGDKAARFVILLHGRGADGDDLLDLQRFWGRLVPEVEFISPNEPFPSSGPLGSPFACGEGDLPLSNPFKGAIPTSIPPGSNECQLTLLC